MLLPDNNTLFGSYIHLIAFLYVKGLIPLGEVSGGHIGPQVAGAVDIHLQQQCLILGLCLLAPDSCPVGEVFLEGNILGIGHDIQGDSHAAVVGDVFADGELSEIMVTVPFEMHMNLRAYEGSSTLRVTEKGEVTDGYTFM